MAALNVVLLEPEIPQNTGNIARTCVATHSVLHLIRPFGFEITDKNLKRAGLDYWQYLDVRYYDDIERFRALNPGAVCRYFTTKAPTCYTDAEYPDGCYLFFGKETKGLPEELLMQNIKDCVRIPMFGEIRSLNLANSVAVAVYEALRRSDFAELEHAGRFAAGGKNV
ncbi:MAG: tRNA (cytidine(34)-2'-O)-methyltransferase [Clostridia bacterium]|nr:tRNA (cytidine(34)-2'-O)-methyltransferase [Clostridia bacterium]